jgi:long-chain acyl-CoA synthetase
MRPVIGDLVYDASKKWLNTCAVNFPGIRALSFVEIDALVGRFAGGLTAAGIGRGDRVVLHLPNSWQWIVAYHAIARIGAVVIPANILLSPAEVSFMSANAGAAAAILPSGHFTFADTPPALIIAAADHAGHAAFDALLDGDYLRPAELSADDLFTIGYTSGTTGTPKGAELTQGNIFSSTALTATIHVRNASDHVYSALPFPHVYGNVVMNACFLVGCELFAPARFDPAQALKDIEAERITLFEGVPTMYYQMLACPEIAGAELSSLTRCTVGGQTMPLAKIEAAAARFGCPMLELWGMTEVSGPATSHSPYWPPRYGSIGLPFPGVEMRVVDLDDRTQPSAPGAAGELLVRGPLVTRGYWGNPAATAAALQEGWLATGDVGRIDAEGYVWIVDRKKDLILTAGYNVYPAELEQVIAAHPAVSMVAVVGFPDEEKGELAHAFVVLHRDAVVTEADILAHCRLSLAAYKVPRVLRFVADLPRTSTGKIMRRALRDKAPGG